MSDSAAPSALSSSRTSILEQILRHGHKLRSAMVRSILDGDPSYVDEYGGVSRDAAPSSSLSQKCFGCSGTALSADFTDEANSCRCDICNKYKNMDRTTNHRNVPLLNLTSRHEPLPQQMAKSMENCYRNKASEYFKYVNSLQVTVNGLILNQAGNRKASASTIDYKYKIPPSSNCSYFIEYSIPETIIFQPKKGSKIDSGLNPNSFRICSKKLQQEEIYFKHTSIHDIISLLDVNLQSIEIKFQVSSRTPRQKSTNVLGHATLLLSSVETTKHLSLTRSLPVLCDGLAMGNLKISLQLGCGRMYFGKEFVEFVINSSKTDPVPSQRSESQVTFDETPTSEKAIYVGSEEQRSTKVNETVYGDYTSRKSSSSSMTSSSQLKSGRSVQTVKSMRFGVSGGSSFKNEDGNNNRNRESTTIQTDIQKSEDDLVLYGLLYISEVQFFEDAIDSYLSCQAFSQGDPICSRIVYKSKNPVFNFYQLVPLLLDESFLTCMRDNSLVVEFWERKNDEDVAFGSFQLPLHQFYVSYKNPLIAKTILKNQSPVILSDWWEPINNHFDGSICGRLKILVAVGAPAQISNLEIERGLKHNSNSVTYIPVRSQASPAQVLVEPVKESLPPVPLKRPEYLAKVPKKTNHNISAKNESNNNIKQHSITAKPTSPVEKQSIKKQSHNRIDVGVQSDLLKMDATEGENRIKNMLESFLGEMIQQQRQQLQETTVVVPAPENSFIVDDLNRSKVATNVQMRKTSDLLDELNAALSLDNCREENSVPKQTNVSDSINPPVAAFKAHVIVESALHLPYKRRCRSKRNKKKNTYEDILPSTYVTFETIPGAELMVSQVVPKSVGPYWDFRSDVMLPVEALLNSQKRVIFKVWRKSDHFSPEPNLESDIVLGFAALDLTVLMAGLPSLQGWFNIIDFSSKCNGQIKIHITPLENLLKYKPRPTTPKKETLPENNIINNDQVYVKSIDEKVNQRKIATQNNTDESLGRALKRKFAELEEITQRLKSRLADVTKEDFDSDADDLSDSFEHDINTLCVEDDYDTCDLLDITIPKSDNQPNLQRNFPLLQQVDNDFNCTQQPTLSQFVSNANEFLAERLVCRDSSRDSAYCSSSRTDIHPILPVTVVSSSTSIISDERSQIQQSNNTNDACTYISEQDKQLIAGKQRIDTLLEKLSLLTASDETFNRHVSGCSVNNGGDNKVSQSNLAGSFNQFNVNEFLNPALFDQLCSTTLLPNQTDSVSNSQLLNDINDVISQDAQFSVDRQAPDGAGNCVVDKNKNFKNV